MTRGIKSWGCSRNRIGFGRDRNFYANPMKDLAIGRNTPVFQPEKVNSPESLQQLRDLGADLFVVAAYGQILSNALLQIPRLGAINVHASLLPKFRGATPVNYAIWKGGVWSRASASSRSSRSWTPAHVRRPERWRFPRPKQPGNSKSDWRVLGARLTADVLEQLDSGTVIRLSQDPAHVSFAPKLTKEQGTINWNSAAEELDFHVRAMQPWPNPYTFLHQPGKKPQRFIVRRLRPSPPASTSEPGAVLECKMDCFASRPGTVPVEILEIQPPGKKR